MLEDPKKTPPTEITKTPVEGDVAQHPEDLKAWKDQTLSPTDRLELYKALVQETLAGIASAFDRAKEAEDVATQKEIMNSPETKRWMKEAAWLQSASAEEFCKRIDRTEVIKLLGKNFLGAEAWKAQGIDVGEAPVIPEAITESLLESDCPLHPGEKIKDTHLLVLVPKTVNEESYTALKLYELCATRKGAGEVLINELSGWDAAWMEQSWASKPQVESEWVLLPKSDPDPRKVPEEKHFRDKKIAAQQEVHEEHYKEYREVKALELMTAAVLNDLTHKEHLLPEYLRCEEQDFYGGRVCVGSFHSLGLRITVDAGDLGKFRFGRALARKS